MKTDFKNIIQALSFFAGLSLSGCAFIDLHSSRTGQTTWSYETPLNIENQRFQHLRSEAKKTLGIHPDQKTTVIQSQTIDQRAKLLDLENGIASIAEKHQYYKFKPRMRNDEERIRFLRTKGLGARENLALKMGLSKPQRLTSPAVLDAIRDADVAVGMTTESVKESWGEPDQIDIAGNPMYGNQKWTYVEYVPSVDGYFQEKRTLYFEGGRVISWNRKPATESDE